MSRASKDGDTASWPRLRVKRVMRAYKVTQKAVRVIELQWHAARPGVIQKGGYRARRRVNATALLSLAARV